MKKLKIVPPEGWEIDKEKSTVEEIIFKEKKKESKLVKRWRDLDVIEGFYINGESDINETFGNPESIANRNIFPTKRLAEAGLVLA